MELKALIFDVDGTLADTEDAHRIAFNDAFAQEGFDWVWDRDLYKALLKVTGGKQRIRFFFEEHAPEMLERDDLDTLIPRLHAIKTDAYVNALMGGAVPLRPGIENLINDARAKGMTITIATTTTPVNVEALIKSNLGADALDWFTVVGDGGVVPNLKPQPDVYLYVLEKLGLEPGETLALEDSRNGLIAATAAKIPCLVVTNDYTLGQDFSEACKVIETYEGVDLAYLQDLHGSL